MIYLILTRMNGLDAMKRLIQSTTWIRWNVMGSCCVCWRHFFFPFFAWWLLILSTEIFFLSFCHFSNQKYYSLELESVTNTQREYNELTFAMEEEWVEEEWVFMTFNDNITRFFEEKEETMNRTELEESSSRMSRERTRRTELSEIEKREEGKGESVWSLRVAERGRKRTENVNCALPKSKVSSQGEEWQFDALSDTFTSLSSLSFSFLFQILLSPPPFSPSLTFERSQTEQLNSTGPKWTLKETDTLRGPIVTKIMLLTLRFLFPYIFSSTGKGCPSSVVGRREW